MAAPVSLSFEERLWVKKEIDKATRKKVGPVFKANASNAERERLRREALVAKLGIEEVRRQERERYQRRKAEKDAAKLQLQSEDRAA